jgi:hypothetical protein
MTDPTPTPEDPWIHRASRMRCNTCMYYVIKQIESTRIGPEIGRCRRRAPTINGYPVVFPSDLCWDHKLEETK